jgi:hypothetical protein
MVMVTAASETLRALHRSKKRVGAAMGVEGRRMSKGRKS